MTPHTLSVYNAPTPRSELIWMRGPVGSDLVNHSGEQPFAIHDDGFFYVPRHVANVLLSSGVSGCVEMPAPSQGEILHEAINAVRRMAPGRIRDALQAATGEAAFALWQGAKDPA